MLTWRSRAQHPTAFSVVRSVSGPDRLAHVCSNGRMQNLSAACASKTMPKSVLDAAAEHPLGYPMIRPRGQASRNRVIVKGQHSLSSNALALSPTSTHSTLLLYDQTSAAYFGRGSTPYQPRSSRRRPLSDRSSYIPRVSLARSTILKQSWRLPPRCLFLRTCSMPLALLTASGNARSPRQPPTVLMLPS